MTQENSRAVARRQHSLLPLLLFRPLPPSQRPSQLATNNCVLQANFVPEKQRAKERVGFARCARPVPIPALAQKIELLPTTLCLACGDFSPIYVACVSTPISSTETGGEERNQCCLVPMPARAMGRPSHPSQFFGPSVGPNQGHWLVGP